MSLFSIILLLLIHLFTVCDWEIFLTFEQLLEVCAKSSKSRWWRLEFEDHIRQSIFSETGPFRMSHVILQDMKFYTDTTEMSHFNKYEHV